ncbi:MAG: O-antigen ligase C-terminal domain-containing protein [Burkholderiales bacterium]|nr:O-antigen ligase C-terminal domain-containing protein [Burkholderiales bacterium]
MTARSGLARKNSQPDALGLFLACLAVCLPMLLAFNLPPSATYFNQASSLLGWGVWMLYSSPASNSPALPRKVVGVIVTLGLLCFAASLWLAPVGQPLALALSGTAMIGAATLVTAAGASAARDGLSSPFFHSLCVGFLLAGLASSAIAIIQVYAPTWADGAWIARTSAEGRAVGNLRQPNHLCSLLLWAIVAGLWLGEARVLRRGIAIALAALMLFTVVLSGSRSGALGALVLALWGLLDARLAKPTRAALLLAPLVYGLFWYGATAWAPHAEHAFGGAGRFSGSGDISSSRFGIWANTIDLIKAQPWIGVGVGEFNFAWTLTEFPGRPVAFFDHTHNLPLQFAVELGLPLACGLLALLSWALWRGARNCLQPLGADQAASPQRAAFVMVLLVLTHSMLEYPLWYAYFLLPAAFALGMCLGKPAAPATLVAAPARASRQALSFRVGSILLVLGAAYSIYDYLGVVVIFAPGDNAPPLAERIAAGQRSVFFSHHAEYAAATTSQDPVAALAAAQRAAHYLLDTRLMMAWADALHANGDTERAKYIAQRLQEFRNPQSAGYFAACNDPALTVAENPYQCQAPQRKFTFRDFR